MFASTISMLTSSTTALAGSRIAPCSKMAPLGRTSSLMMAVETGDQLVEDNLGAASESGYTRDKAHRPGVSAVCISFGDRATRAKQTTHIVAGTPERVGP